MRNKTTKIALIILSGLVLYSCSLVKRVPEGKHLLEKVDITVNGEKKNEDILKDLLYQQPNSELLGYHLRLHMYNLATPNADSSYHAWLDRKPGRHERMRALLSEKQVQRLSKSFVVSGFSNFLKKTGEPPVIVDINRVKKSRNRLFAYYYKQGYFRAIAGFKIDTLPNKRAPLIMILLPASLIYLIAIYTYIETPDLDSLYNRNKKESIIKSGQAV